MGNNTEKFDHVAHYKAKTLKQLQSLLAESEAFAVKYYPKFDLGNHNEYIQKLKLLIAERIGRD